MKSIKWIIGLLLVVAAGTGNVWADRGRVHFGLTIGPYWGPWHYAPAPYYYPPSYPAYYPPVMVEPAPPPVYIEQAPPLAAAPVTNYWYYCNASRGYYPYVKECPSGWQRVSPQPPGQP